MSPATIFLDVDGVLCPEDPYGCSHVQHALAHPLDRPIDLFERLFLKEPVEVLDELLREFSPKVVLTTSWLSSLTRQQFIEVFNRCGLQGVAKNLHEEWHARAVNDMSRLQCIENWLERHHLGGAILVLDDVRSGESLIDSFFSTNGRAVLCDSTGCLQRSHLRACRAALARPYSHDEPWA